MNSATSIASSALQAFSISQQVTANNVANLNTDNFTASRTSLQANSSGGVNATVSGTKDTVDISREAVNIMSNTSGFNANLKVLKASDEMTKELFSIKA